MYKKLLLAGILIALLFIFLTSCGKKEPSMDPEALEQLQVDLAETRYSITVHKLHKQLNRQFGWNSLDEKVFNDEYYGQRWRTSIFILTRELLEDATVDSEVKERFVIDLMTAAKLTTVLDREENGNKRWIVAAKDLHRIFHDLDYWVFDNYIESEGGEKTYFGVTKTIEEEGGSIATEPEFLEADWLAWKRLKEQLQNNDEWMLLQEKAEELEREF